MKELLDVSSITIYRWITINLLGIKDSKTASMLVPNSVKDNEILLLKYTRKNANKLLQVCTHKLLQICPSTSCVRTACSQLF
jgi:hypothetical protein